MKSIFFLECSVIAEIVTIAITDEKPDIHNIWWKASTRKGRA